MSRDDVLATLKKFKNEHGEKFDLLEIGIFGSFSRGEESADSDVDIFIKTKNPNPFVIVHMKKQIESLLNTSVDIVRLRDNMNRYLKAQIDKDALYV